MEYQAECFVTLAQLLEMPDHAFAAHLALATDPELVPPCAAAHIALFAERVADLSLEERQELFVETFRSAMADEERRAVVSGLRLASGPVQPGPLGRSLEHLQSALLNDRNPYHHLLVAIGTLLRSSSRASG